MVVPTNPRKCSSYTYMHALKVTLDRILIDNGISTRNGCIPEPLIIVLEVGAAATCMASVHSISEKEPPSVT